MFLICSNAAQGILSSFSFRYAATNLFKMLLKYRPDDKAARKESLLKRAQAESEGETVEAKKPIAVKYGPNHVAYLIEQNKAQLVVITHDVDPIELVVWLPTMYRKMEVPYCIVKGKACLGSVDTVVYLVDAADKERFAESKKELDALLADDSLVNVPFLILGNKIDIPYGASEEELRYYLGLSNFTTGKGNVNLADSNVRPLEIFMCSVVRKMGYGEGFKWISQYIK